MKNVNRFEVQYEKFERRPKTLSQNVWFNAGVLLLCGLGLLSVMIMFGIGISSF